VTCVFVERMRKEAAERMKVRVSRKDLERGAECEELSEKEHIFLGMRECFAPNAYKIKGSSRISGICPLTQPLGWFKSHDLNPPDLQATQLL